MWHQVSGGECHGDGVLDLGGGAAAHVPKAALGGLSVGLEQPMDALTVGQDQPIMQIRSRRQEMEASGRQTSPPRSPAR